MSITLTRALLDADPTYETRMIDGLTLLQKNYSDIPSRLQTLLRCYKFVDSEINGGIYQDDFLEYFKITLDGLPSSDLLKDIKALVTELVGAQESSI